MFLHGLAANKFIYTCDGSTLVNQHPLSVRRICGERNILELNGHEHKRERGPCIISPACRAISTTAEGCSFGTNQFAIHMLQS